MSLFITLRSELFKIKRTAALYFTIAAAAFGPFMSMLDLVFDGRTVAWPAAFDHAGEHR